MPKSMLCRSGIDPIGYPLSCRRMTQTMKGQAIQVRSFHGRIEDSLADAILETFTFVPKNTNPGLVPFAPSVIAGKPASEKVNECANFWRRVGAWCVHGIKRRIRWFSVEI